MRLYIFYVDDDYTVARIPLAKWERVSSKQQCMPEFSGQSIKIAYAYIEVENRNPVFCPRIDGVICRFDSSGKMIDSTLPPIDLLTDLNRGREKVVDLRTKINQHNYDKSNRWEVNQTIIQKIISVIWN